MKLSDNRKVPYKISLNKCQIIQTIMYTNNYKLIMNIHFYSYSIINVTSLNSYYNFGNLNASNICFCVVEISTFL